MAEGGDNGGAVGFRQGCARVGQKMRGLLSLKQVQRRDVRAQRCDVPEGGAANVAALRSNVATWQRGYKSNVTTLRSNVATFQRGIKLTSRR